MEQPHQRIEKFLKAFGHHSRRTESVIYGRLLYKSKNQHRHGLYFRRLQHVRRTLRDVDAHDVWVSLEESIANNRDASGECMMNVTSSTRDKAIALLHVLDNLVDRVIPAATRSISMHLISMRRFLPFAVTMCACMARIFVIHYTLRENLRPILTDLNVLAGGSAKDEVGEDVGTAVSLGEELLNSNSAGKQGSELTPKQDEIEDGDEDDDFMEQRSTKKIEGASSLYELMVQDGVDRETVEKMKNEAEKLQKACLGGGSDSETNDVNNAKKKKNSRKRKCSSNVSDAAPASSKKKKSKATSTVVTNEKALELGTLTSPSDEGDYRKRNKVNDKIVRIKDKTKLKSLNKTHSSQNKSKKNEDDMGSDSENLDDIFGTTKEEISKQPKKKKSKLKSKKHKSTPEVTKTEQGDEEPKKFTAKRKPVSRPVTSDSDDLDDIFGVLG